MHRFLRHLLVFAFFEVFASVVSALSEAFEQFQNQNTHSFPFGIRTCIFPEEATVIKFKILNYYDYSTVSTPPSKFKVKGSKKVD